MARRASPGESAAPTEVTVVVLAGGSSARFGRDKLAAPLGRSTVLHHLLDSLPHDWSVVVVGPRRQVSRPVAWAREDPPGGGPLAGIAAGIHLVETPVLLVVAGDMPYAAPALTQLVDALASRPDVDAAVALDGTGTLNPLLAAYRLAPVRTVLAGPVHGRAARELLRLSHVEVEVEPRTAHDIDTPEDLPPRH